MVLRSACSYVVNSSCLRVTLWSGNPLHSCTHYDISAHQTAFTCDALKLRLLPWSNQCWVCGLIVDCEDIQDVRAVVRHLRSVEVSRCQPVCWVLHPDCSWIPKDALFDTKPIFKSLSTLCFLGSREVHFWSIPKAVFRIKAGFHFVTAIPGEFSYFIKALVHYLRRREGFGIEPLCQIFRAVKP